MSLTCTDPVHKDCGRAPPYQNLDLVCDMVRYANAILNMCFLSTLPQNSTMMGGKRLAKWQWKQIIEFVRVVLFMVRLLRPCKITRKPLAERYAIFAWLLHTGSTKLTGRKTGHNCTAEA